MPETRSVKFAAQLLNAVATLGVGGCSDVAGVNAAECSDSADTALALGKWHGCALRTDSTATCWGDNYFLQLDVPIAD